MRSGISVRTSCLVVCFSLASGAWGLPTERAVTIGSNANFEQNLAQTAHLGWSRIDIEWSRINPSNGVWSWSFTDAQIGNAHDLWGQQILGVLHYPPAWVGGGPNQNIAPLSTSQWSEFVRRVAQRYAGKIAAYEVWNEPDDPGTSSFGIGWGRPVGEPPTYVDFLKAAEVEILANSSATVSGPALKTRNTPSATSTRKNSIWAMIATTPYPDGHYAWEFMGASTFHNNAASTESSASMAQYLNGENLLIRNNQCLLCRGQDVWVTEYGYRSNATGESGQREKICNLTRNYTGRLNTYLRGNFFNVTQAYIFVLKADSSSASIFRSDYTPKPVVTQYLQHLATPAVQNPAVSADYPNCATGASAVAEITGRDAWNGLNQLGLEDPRRSSLRGFEDREAVLDPSSGTFFANLRGSRGEQVSIEVRRLGEQEAPVGERSENNFRWVRNGRVFEVAGFKNGLPLGRDRVEVVANELNPSRAFGCVQEWSSPDDNEMKRLQIRPPVVPKGFANQTSTLEVARFVGACSSSLLGMDPVIDLSWVFEGPSGEQFTAGVYRYEGGTDESLQTDDSIHWRGAGGLRYWVATSPLSPAIALGVLKEVGRSMDSTMPF